MSASVSGTARSVVSAVMVTETPASWRSASMQQMVFCRR